jgi:hypothetical protein
MTARKGRPPKSDATLEALGFKVLETEIYGDAVTYLLGRDGAQMTMTAYKGEDIVEIARGWLRA